ncbi:hypothetical protein [Paenibacillus sophorae]|uniref:Uncharacterized protein n=1 Tax=Paenibacillus sophorae TaxID=1333845 RepID=A0ABX8HE88_9BACL|nr:hypothetical protein [Paenibacillus sophorae]QWU16217.1 hypothetical protein KP014_02795 [Paenibacillus sophorae]
MDVTENQQETYERLVEAEDRLIRQLETCELAPSAKTAKGAFAFRKQKSPPPGTASFCDPKKLAESRLRRLFRHA